MYPPNSELTIYISKFKKSRKFGYILTSKFMLVAILCDVLSLLGNLPAVQSSVENRDEARIATNCGDCSLVSSAMEDLIHKPRQVDSRGVKERRLDLEKIKKSVCKSFMKDGDRESCRKFFFEHLDAAERWASNNSKLSYYDFVCIKTLKLCCSEGSYGPRCSRCPKCGPHQACLGDGTRTGNGTCVCRKGHTGEDCTNCENGFYQDPNILTVRNPSTRQPLCKPCHKSCSNCRGEGPTKCDVCKDGYALYQDYGCSDVDECVKSNNKICGPNTFCVNTEGSYFCYECDRACDGCHGDGPDMCNSCAVGHFRDQAGVCRSSQKTVLDPELSWYRMAIYFGLCVSTCIVMFNNTYIAAGIGLVVSVYIVYSEYIISELRKRAEDFALKHSGQL